MYDGVTQYVDVNGIPDMDYMSGLIINLLRGGAYNIVVDIIGY
jgi:hypothetical protein